MLVFGWDSTLESTDFSDTAFFDWAVTCVGIVRGWALLLGMSPHAVITAFDRMPVMYRVALACLCIKRSSSKG